MAKGRAKSASNRQQTDLTHLVVLDALRTWVIPAAAAAIVFVTYVVYNIALVSEAVAVTLVGCVALLVLLFYGLRSFLEQVPHGRRAVLLAGFAVAWCAVTFYPFYRTVNPGTPLFTADLSRDGAPITIPLHDRPGHYNLLVEGHFLPVQAREDRRATYHIALGHDGAMERVLEGTFHQEWGSQRVGSGRRSSRVPVMHETTMVLDELDDPDGHDLTMQVQDLSPDVRDSVTVRVYAPSVPRSVLIPLGVLTLAGAVVVDAWRPKGDSQGLMATLTAAALVAVAVFRSSSVATPGFPQLIVAGLVGALGGAVGGSVLSRVAQPLRKRLQ